MVSKSFLSNFFFNKPCVDLSLLSRLSNPVSGLKNISFATSWHCINRSNSFTSGSSFCSLFCVFRFFVLGTMAGLLDTAHTWTGPCCHRHRPFLALSVPFRTLLEIVLGSGVVTCFCVAILCTVVLTRQAWLALRRRVGGDNDIQMI